MGAQLATKRLSSVSFVVGKAVKFLFARAELLRTLYGVKNLSEGTEPTAPHHRAH